ncbi:MAG TPA: phage holin family protein [Thermoanaerobaculia bacterium]|jgi:hypothetical protein|nr:phage holin family protein [Thermoanaerobaculia bacterium]
MSSVRQERSLGELFSDLTEQTRVLVRQEIDLAKTEVSEKVSGVGKDIGSMVAGATVLFIGALTLVAALVIGLGHLITYGGAALLVGVIVTGAGAWLVMRGLNDIKQRNFKPEKTAQALKETKQWAKEQI